MRRPHLGVTLFRCFECNVVLAVPFSCQTRICPCCIARKAEQAALQLDERLPLVAHRHLVISMAALGQAAKELVTSSFSV
ncbi:MAG: transposase zinc-binding domain-containing protein [Armatimonadetes bacterium]|nr:transposase zinc-binding domain-containing protein [Armatimonadota bacterium]